MQISESTTIAEKEKSKVAVIVDQVTKKAGEIALVKNDAERDLAAAKPALDAALSALNSITPKDIVGLKALKNPPDVVKRIFDCVLILRYFPILPNVVWQDVKGAMVLLGNYPEAVRMMGDMAFLDKLVNFPKVWTSVDVWGTLAGPNYGFVNNISGFVKGPVSGHILTLILTPQGYGVLLTLIPSFSLLPPLPPQEQINDETVELLEPYFNGPDFNFESAKKASGNVAGLCNWAEAMCTYHVVAKVVEPKIATLREAEAELKIATKVRMGGEWRGAGERGCDRPTV